MKKKKQKFIHLGDSITSCFSLTPKGIPYSVTLQQNIVIISIRGRFKTEIKRKEINHLIKHTRFSLQRSKHIRFATNKKKQLEERMNELITWIDESGLIEIIDECPFCLESGCDAFAPIGQDYSRVHYKCYKEAMNTLDETQNGKCLKAFWRSTLICMLLSASFSLFCVGFFDTRPAAIFYIVPHLFCSYYLNNGGKGGKTALVYTLIASMLSFISYIAGLLIYVASMQELPLIQMFIAAQLALIRFIFSNDIKIFLPEIAILVIGLFFNPFKVIYKKDLIPDVIEAMKTKVKRIELDDRFNYFEKLDQQ
ncbi:MAG: hypothetical protein IKU28_03885 [Erysipelotrichaceae bacterium]|nr:hypothetical protein [Erysipelotrichaceae bacterium]